MSFEFGKANARELYEIAALYAAASVTPGCSWRSGYPSLETAAADLEAGTLYRFVDEEGRVVAAATLCLPGNFPKLIPKDMKKPCELSRLCTHPSLQGLGLGGELLDRMLLEALTLGYDGAVLLVAEGNTRARRLYAARGFSEAGDTHRYNLDFVLMQRSLSPKP
ncbi:MAG TPA: GNAT family N-acetyltransferase [Candidatus Acidoferrum sp.]|nr:GNAT family N-acetyltransferase [Candidatus Acidoferrum sp.]